MIWKIIVVMYWFQDKLSERAKGLKADAAMQSYQMASKSVHNRRQVKKKGTGMNRWIGNQKGKR